MTRRRYAVGGLALLSLGLAAGSGAAAAQTTIGHHAHVAPIKSVVMQVGSGNLQVRTTGGTVTVPFTAATRIFTITPGTTADLVPNARVQLQLAAGTTTVNSVQLEAAHATFSGAGRGEKAAKHAWKGAHARTGTHSHPGMRDRAGGQIVSFSGGTLTLKTRGGQTATFTLAGNVTITKLAVGTDSDLKTGETVQVMAATGGPTWAITILNG